MNPAWPPLCIGIPGRFQSERVFKITANDSIIMRIALSLSLTHSLTFPPSVSAIRLPHVMFVHQHKQRQQIFRMRSFIIKFIRSRDNTIFVLLLITLNRKKIFFSFTLLVIFIKFHRRRRKSCCWRNNLISILFNLSFFLLCGNKSEVRIKSLGTWEHKQASYIAHLSNLARPRGYINISNI